MAAATAAAAAVSLRPTAGARGRAVKPWVIHTGRFVLL